MRAGAMAIVFGVLVGLGLFLATAWLLIRGGPQIGPTLSLLGNYFPGYSVTWPGSVIGFGYGVLLGSAVGWSLARLYNYFAERG
jgi:hypothetical protein